MTLFVAVFSVGENLLDRAENPKSGDCVACYREAGEAVKEWASDLTMPSIDTSGSPHIETRVDSMISISVGATRNDNGNYFYLNVEFKE